MSLLSSTQPSLRARVIARFPARVIAGNAITITKANGTYTFAATIDDVALSQLADMSTDRLLGRDTDGSGVPEELTVSGGIGFTAAGGIQIDPNHRLRQVFVELYNGGSAIGTGVIADRLVPFACTIKKVTLLADQSGSIVVDIWKDTYANFPPDDTDSITDSAPPTISADVSSQDATLTGWTTSIAAGDVLRFNVDSAATVTRVSLCLDVEVV